MRKILIALAATAAFASPALANEARVEARGGVIWSDGDTQDFWGMAAGYDFDLGEKAFAGLEVSGDTMGTSGTKGAFGVTGRLGAKVSEKGKLFVDGGYTTEPCDLCEDSRHLGAGYEQGFGNNLYGKVAYRHYFVGNGFSDSDAVTVGLGIKF
ncbi:MAG: hypothetical protein ACK56H_02320 [Novosphingobium sp.]